MRNIQKFTNKTETFHHLKVCIAIEKHLISKGFQPRREWYLVLDHEDRIIGLPRFEITQAEKLRRERYRCPDIMYWNNGLWIIEIDGYIHHIKSEKTNKRNEIYRNNNCNFIIIETFEIKDGSSRVTNKPIEKIINEVDELLTRKIK